MNTIAILSDIHSNYYALQAVLLHIQKHRAQHIYCLGDIVGYHTMPNETIELLQKHGVTAIMGNHDRDIIQKRYKPHKTPDIFRWTHESLTKNTLSWLKNLPLTRTIGFGKASFTLCHGSPESMDAYCYEDTDYTRHMARSVTTDFLACGHTHLPWYKTYHGTTVLNPGSVGRPKSGRPRASWALLTADGDQISVDLMETDYDHAAMAAHVRSHGFDDYARTLETGKA
ncbi:MAG: metallophosphoesterase family protein [Fibrobacterota bacterium]